MTDGAMRTASLTGLFRSLVLADAALIICLLHVGALAQPSPQSKRDLAMQLSYFRRSKKDLPFLAWYLYDDPNVGFSAVRTIERITGEDLGTPKHEGPFSMEQVLRTAQNW